MDFARGLSTRVHRAHTTTTTVPIRQPVSHPAGSRRAEARTTTSPPPLLPRHMRRGSGSALICPSAMRVRPCLWWPQLAGAVTVGFRCSASTTPRARGARWWFPHGDRVPRHRPGSCADASSRLRASIPFRSIHRRAPISMMPPTQRRGATGDPYFWSG